MHAAWQARSPSTANSNGLQLSSKLAQEKQSWCSPLTFLSRGGRLLVNAYCSTRVTCSMAVQ
jgi:hypothetical protein